MDQAFVPFDDSRADLGPLSDLRASFEQRSGGLTLLERCRLAGNAAAVAVPNDRAALAAERTSLPANAPVDGAIYVNGALHAPFSADVLAALAGLADGEAIVGPGGRIAAARLSGSRARAFVEWIASGAPGTPPEPALGREHAAFSLWSRPWHLLEAAAFDRMLAGDAAQVSESWTPGILASVPAHAARVGDGALHVHPAARIGIGVVFDTTAGAVLVDEHAEVRHGTVINGPAFIGARTIVAERTLVKPRTAIGPQCRVAGEVGSVVFQACSNKAHDGHLGDALLGEWVNLGAGTVNSNLLNTYGEVVMRLRPRDPLERTGRQFMGCVIGDHAKLAIGTRIMTGSSIGTGSMWASGAAVSGATGSYAWVTDDGVRRYRLDKFMDVARTVVARRGATLGPAAAAGLRRLHEEAAA